MVKIGMLEVSAAYPRVVATVETVGEAQAAVAQGADIVEVRPDLFQPQTLENAIRALIAVNGAVPPETPLLGTIRLPKDGGKWAGSEPERYAMMEEVIHYVDAIDIEVDSSMRDSLIQLARSKNVAVICSYHNMGRTPMGKPLRQLIEEMSETGCDVMKIALMAREFADLRRMCYLLVEHVTSDGKPIAMVSMGAEGRAGRKRLPWLGSCFTYGCVAEPKAPGQVKIPELVESIAEGQRAYKLPIANTQKAVGAIEELYREHAAC
jgi:3-dehydroquinate dehydratase-1